MNLNKNLTCTDVQHFEQKRKGFILDPKTKEPTTDPLPPFETETAVFQDAGNIDRPRLTVTIEGAPRGSFVFGQNHSVTIDQIPVDAPVAKRDQEAAKTDGEPVGAELVEGAGQEAPQARKGHRR